MKIEDFIINNVDDEGFCVKDIFEDFKDGVPCEENHYTGEMTQILENNHGQSILITNNTSGQAFEKVTQLYLEKEYGFEIFSRGRRSVPNGLIEGQPYLRILKKDVSMSTLENILNKNIGKLTNSYRRSVTEFVIEIWGAKPTEQFPLSSFDDDGVLRIRIECKTQTSVGSIDKKIPGCIFDLKYGSNQSNIILLMSGSYFKDYHYQEAKFYSSNSWVNKHCPIPEKNIVVMDERDFVEWCRSAMGNK